MPRPPKLVRKRYFTSLKTQILFCYILTASCIVVAISLVIGHVSMGKLTDLAIDGTEKDLMAISEKFDGFFDNIESDALYVTYTRQSFEQAGGKSESPYDNFVYINRIYSSLLDIVHTNPKFQSAAYYEGDQVFLSDLPAKDHGIDAGHVKTVEEFEKSKSILRWLDVHPIPYNVLAESRKFPYLISILRKSFDTRGFFLGIVELNFSADSLSSIYEINNTSDASFLIINEEGTICSSPDAALIGTTADPAGYAGLLQKSPVNGIAAAQDQSYLYVFQEYPRMNWKIVGVVSQESITAHSRTLVVTIFLVGLGGILLSIFIFAQIAGKITDPLQKITSTVELVAGGDYTQRISVSSGDEIGILGERINTMIASITSLMEDIQTENQQKREFELSYIQSQMNPHFLYNTLETLCGMISTGDQEEAISVIGDISQFYRGVLTGSEHMVTLKKELSIVESYLHIMSRRFPGAFSCEFDLAKESLPFQIPKLTLQPIVENAVIHGCIPARRPCHITIASKIEGCFLHLTVTDDGVGMTAEELLTMMRGESQGFGLSNTENRLKLHLGNAVKLKIESEAGHGVRVSLLLPLTAAEEGHV